MNHGLDTLDLSDYFFPRRSSPSIAGSPRTTEKIRDEGSTHESSTDQNLRRLEITHPMLKRSDHLSYNRFVVRSVFSQRFASWTSSTLFFRYPVGELQLTIRQPPRQLRFLFAGALKRRIEIPCIRMAAQSVGDLIQLFRIMTNFPFFGKAKSSYQGNHRISKVWPSPYITRGT